VLAEIAAKADVVDYRLIAYGEWKGLLAAAIRQMLPSCPPLLVADAFSDVTKVALEVLAPHARDVVRGWGHARECSALRLVRAPHKAGQVLPHHVRWSRRERGHGRLWDWLLDNVVQRRDHREVAQRKRLRL